MKTLFEQSGGTYRKENGYLIPNLKLPTDEPMSIKWTRKIRKNWIQLE